MAYDYAARLALIAFATAAIQGLATRAAFEPALKLALAAAAAVTSWAGFAAKWHGASSKRAFRSPHTPQFLPLFPLPPHVHSPVTRSLRRHP